MDKNGKKMVNDRDKNKYYPQKIRLHSIFEVRHDYSSLGIVNPNQNRFLKVTLKLFFVFHFGFETRTGVFENLRGFRFLNQKPEAELLNNSVT